MNKSWHLILRHRLARAGMLLLILLYGSAILANFLAPYSAQEEFRDLFYHPPTSIHFRDEERNLVAPYVIPSHLIDPGKHHFREGSPLWIGFSIQEKNTSPYIRETIYFDKALAVLENSKGEHLGAIVSIQETGEDTGVFGQQTTIHPLVADDQIIIRTEGKQIVYQKRNNQYVRRTSDPGVLLLNDSGEELTSFHTSLEKSRIRFFVHGSPYKLFGLIRTDIHLFGVESPGHFFLMGTDQLGRDIFSRILFGARISLTIGLIGVLLSTCLGMWIGGLAGYFGGLTDAVLMRAADVLLSIPALYLLLSVRNAFSLELSSVLTYLLMILVLSLTGWAGIARVIRGMTLSLREQEFVLAAKALGARPARILLQHILPNTLGYVIVRATVLIPAYILAEVTLSYLGIGIHEPAASWGNMLSAAQELRVLEQFWWILYPGLFLFLAVLGFHFLGEGLRDLQISPQTTRSTLS